MTAKRESPHLLDQVAGELVSWLQIEPSYFADAIRGGGRAPFAANVTEAEKRDYYQRRLFNPDGSPNQQGRDEELARVGPEEYAAMFRQVRGPKPVGPMTAGVQDEPMPAVEGEAV